MEPLAADPSSVVIRFVGFSPGPHSTVSCHADGDQDICIKDGGDHDVVTSHFLTGLAYLARTIRFEHLNQSVQVVLRLCSTAEDFRNALCESAYLTVVSAHGMPNEAVLQDGEGELRVNLKALGAASIRTSGLLMDTCNSLGDTPIFHALRAAASPGTVLLGVRGTAHYTHGPLVLPAVLNRVLRPNPAPSAQGAALKNQIGDVLRGLPAQAGFPNWAVVVL